MTSDTVPLVESVPRRASRQVARYRSGMEIVLTCLYVLGALLTLFGAASVLRIVMRSGTGYDALDAFATHGLGRGPVLRGFLIAGAGIVLSTVASVWSLWL
ncbi:hypothetical protein AB0O87_06210 [Microbacterium sp. NPDC076768]|uniref:hypothetical protein n=1 Tax=Microbacterium sp. NPDC076768 TaxID=3154858 RepID=UPI003427DA0B